MNIYIIRRVGDSQFAYVAEETRGKAKNFVALSENQKFIQYRSNLISKGVDIDTKGFLSENEIAKVCTQKQKEDLKLNRAMITIPQKEYQELLAKSDKMDYDRLKKILPRLGKYIVIKNEKEDCVYLYSTNANLETPYKIISKIKVFFREITEKIKRRDNG